MPLIHIEIRISFHKQEDIDLDNAVSDLKARRQLSSVVRDGIRLVLDLQAGRLDVLKELFPFVSRSFVQDSVQDSVQDKPVGLKPIQGFMGIVAPGFDDDEDTLIIRKDVNADAGTTDNFLQSISKYMQ